MARYVIKIKTPMSVEDTFDFMADMRNFKTWDPGVSSAELVKGDAPRLGAEFDLTANGTDLTYVLVEYDRPSRVVAEANTARLRSYDVIEVVGEGDGSIVTYDAALELKGIFALGEPIMRAIFKRIVRQAEEGLRAALDGTKVD